MYISILYIIGLEAAVSELVAIIGFEAVAVSELAAAWGCGRAWRTWSISRMRWLRCRDCVGIWGRGKILFSRKELNASDTDPVLVTNQLFCINFWRASISERHLFLKRIYFWRKRMRLTYKRLARVRRECKSKKQGSCENWGIGVWVQVWVSTF